MENKINDENIRAFFGKHTTEIADNGFSRKVNAALPKYSDRSWIVWVFAAMGLCISLLVGFNTGFFGRILNVVFEMPYYYWLAAMFALPLMVAGYYFSTSNYFSNLKI